MKTRPCLSRDACEEALAVGLVRAESQGWNVTIAIVDDAGFPIHLSRMDETSPASVETAVQKARSSALTGVDSKMLEDVISKRPGVATMGRVAVEGGVALLWQGHRVGGVGVSGVQSHEDAIIAGVVRDALLCGESARS
jgi:glc operon protein GlcG